MNFHWIWTKFPEDMVERIMNQDECELEYDFPGFLDNYFALSKMIPKHFTILDCGCYLATQCWFFRKHKAYIGLDYTELERFSVPNVTHYVGDAVDWIEKHRYELPQSTFAISNYADYQVENAICKHFRHLFCYYPEHDESRETKRFQKILEEVRQKFQK